MNLIPPALRSARNRWLLLAAAWVAMLVLGIGGFLQQEADGGLDRTTLDTLYLTLQLMTLDYGGGDVLNWRLEVARFVAPVLAASTILQTARSALQTQFERLRLRFVHDHVVVAGLDEVGGRLAAAFAGAGRRVVAVEMNPAAPGVGTAKAAGVPVVVGDPTDPEVLGEVRLDRAADLVVVGTADARNVEIVATARSVDRPARRAALRCAVQLLDPELCRLLRDYGLQANSAARVEFFNVFEQAGRSWVAEWPPFGDGGQPAHLVLFGAGRLGSVLAVAAAQRWRDDHEEPMRLTIVDRAAHDRWATLVTRHPALADAVDATLLDLDLTNPTPEALGRVAEALRQRPTAVAVAFDDDARTLSTALWVREQLDDASIPVVMRAWTEGGLTRLLEGVDGPGFGGLHLFPVLDRSCTTEVVTGGVREQLARAMHDDYLARSGSRGGALARPWLELADAERESSRRRADHLCARLAQLDFDLAPLRHWGSAPPLDDEVALALAADDHERWLEERLADGWCHGPERDDEAKVNPLLVGWDELPADVRRANAEAVKALPEQLARAGLELERTRRPAAQLQ